MARPNHFHLCNSAYHDSATRLYPCSSPATCTTGLEDMTLCPDCFTAEAEDAWNIHDPHAEHQLDADRWHGRAP